MSDTTDVKDITNHRMAADAIDIGIITGTAQRALCGVRFVPVVHVGSSGRADVKGAKMCPDCDEIRDTWRQIKKLQDKLLRKFRIRYLADPEIDAAMALTTRSRSVQERTVST